MPLDGLLHSASEQLLNHPFAIALPLATLLLSIGIYTTTISSCYAILRYLRLILAVPCCALWAVVAYPRGVSLEGATQGAAYTLGAVGFMKTWDVLVTGFLDAPRDIPRWTALKCEDKEGALVVGRVALPLPQTFEARVAYTFDYLFCLRGASFFQGYAFDWAPREIYSYRIGGYTNFLKRNLRTLGIELVLVNALKYYVSQYPWNFGAPDPFTTLPWSAQAWYTIPIGLFVYCMTMLPVQAASTFAVPLLRMNPDSWAPIWRKPWLAHSLSDFWTVRWHWTFRRLFWRIAYPFVRGISPFLGRKSAKLVRAVAVFGVSTLFHLGVHLGLRGSKFYVAFPLWGYVRFFMAQPVGLLIEDMVVNPFTEKLPGRWKSLARRVYVWIWIVWTGRWFCDGYILLGLFVDPWVHDEALKFFL